VRKGENAAQSVIPAVCAAFARYLLVYKGFLIVNSALFPLFPLKTGEKEPLFRGLPAGLEPFFTFWMFLPLLHFLTVLSGFDEFKPVLP